MKFCNRTRRIANEIQKCIAVILQFEMRDPRVVGVVTVSGIDVSKDLSYARVYVTFLNTKGVLSVNQLDEKIKILHDASGFIRTSLARDMSSLRIVPELSFVYDDSAVESMRIYRLLTKIS